MILFSKRFHRALRQYFSQLSFIMGKKRTLDCAFLATPSPNSKRRKQYPASFKIKIIEEAKIEEDLDEIQNNEFFIDDE